MIYTNNTLVDIAGLKGIYELIQKTCNSHIAVSQHKVGYDILSDNSDKQYPLSFLDSNISSEVDGSLETFNIALSIADRLPNDYSEEDLINVKSKIDQIISELHYKLENVATNIKISGLDKLHYDDVNEDVLAIIRGELSVTIPRYTAHDAVSLEVPEYGSNSVKYSVEFNTTLEDDAIVNHNLNTTDITVQFYLKGERISVDYTIVDENNVAVNTDEAIEGLDIVIFASSVGSVSKYSGFTDLYTGGFPLEHNLNNKRIIAQFYHNNERIEVNYSIIDANTINITSDVALDDVKVVIMASNIVHTINLTADSNRLLNHNLKSEDIMVQFYRSNQLLNIDYTILDENNIIVKSNSSLTTVIVVIFR
jgi:hypothetical protein